MKLLSNEDFHDMRILLKQKSLFSIALGLAVTWCRKSWSSADMVKFLCKKIPMLISFLVARIHKILTGVRRKIALNRLFFAIPTNELAKFKLTLKIPFI